MTLKYRKNKGKILIRLNSNSNKILPLFLRYFNVYLAHHDDVLNSVYIVYNILKNIWKQLKFTE